MIPFLVPLMMIGAAGVVVGEAIKKGVDLPEIPNIDFGVTETIERITMMMVISTVCIVLLAVTFTYLYPKWK